MADRIGLREYGSTPILWDKGGAVLPEILFDAHGLRLWHHRRLIPDVQLEVLILQRMASSMIQTRYGRLILVAYHGPL